MVADHSNVVDDHSNVIDDHSDAVVDYSVWLLIILMWLSCSHSSTVVDFFSVVALLNILQFRYNG